MRSEERSGIVFLFVLFLWGTPVTEPFRVFAEYLSKFLFDFSDKIKLNEEGIPANILNFVFLCIIGVLLLLLSKTKFVTVMPLLALQLTITVMVIYILRDYIFDTKRMAVYLVLLVAVSLLFALRKEKILIWLADLYIFSIPVFLLCGLLLKNFNAMNFIAGKQTVSYSECFNGVFGINGILWGLFWLILVFLPLIYNIPGRRK